MSVAQASRIRLPTSSTLMMGEWLSAVAGLILSAMMVYGNLFYKELPCLDKDGQCSRLSLNPAANVFGAPASVIQLVLYSAYAALIVASMFWGGKAPSLRTVARGVGVAALLVSGLLYAYLNFVRAGDCLGFKVSIALLALSVMCGTVLAERKVEWHQSRTTTSVFSVGAGLGVIGLGLISWAFQQTPSIVPLNLGAVDRMPPELLLSDAAHTLGPSSAEETFVIFVDGECPFCARAYPVLYEAAKVRSDVRLVYRSYPLKSHQYAFDDAIGAELAAERGKLWEFEAALFDSKRSGGAQEILISQGWKEEEISRRLTPQDPARLRVLRDLALGDRLGIQAVPVIISIKNGRSKVVSEEYVRWRVGR